MQILNFFITLLLNIGLGFVFFFFLIIGLNGFSESQAAPGLIFYIVWAVFFSSLSAGLSVVAAKYLINKKSLSPVAAAAICAPIFIVVGGVLIFLGIFIAAILVSALR